MPEAQVRTRAFASALLARSASDQELVIPRLWTLLRGPKFSAFTVQMPKARSSTHADGWFHPSTHPLWGERLLWYYLHSAEPGSAVVLEREVLEPSSTLAIYQGHWLHAFLQHLLLDAKVLVAIPSRTGPQAEVPVVDETLRSRGHMDGLLDVETLGLDAPVGLEIKSMGGWKMSDIPKAGAGSSGKLAWLIAKNPGYYLQAQEYMRMYGHRLQCMLIVSPGYPFDMSEIHIPFDEDIAQGIATKYAGARRHLAEGSLPDPCCAVGSAQASSCPARYVCPIGTASTSMRNS